MDKPHKTDYHVYIHPTQTSMYVRLHKDLSVHIQSMKIYTLDRSSHKILPPAIFGFSSLSG